MTADLRRFLVECAATGCPHALVLLVESKAAAAGEARSLGWSDEFCPAHTQEVSR